MFKVKKGDLVQIIKGKDRGKKGKVLSVFTGSNRALVEGLNFVKKHRRQRSQEDKGGIISIEAPISISNLMPFCKSCAKPVRAGFMVDNDKNKVRFCKGCKQPI
jgi:large subunit ribosomal protein L24